MAREPGAIASLAQAVRLAYLAVDAAIPLPAASASDPPSTEYQARLQDILAARQLALKAALHELAEFEYALPDRMIRLLQRGQIPDASGAEG